MKRIIGKIKRSHLHDTIITLLGLENYHFQPKLKAEIRNKYANIKETEVDSAVETLLLELEESGIIQLEPGDRITLTESGVNENKLLVQKQKEKQRNKFGKAIIKTKRLEIQKKKEESKDIHERLKSEIGRLAVLLGKTWMQEYQLVKGGPAILDIVWYDKLNEMNISHAFEVQHRGEWKNALGNLDAVKRRYPSCKLFVLIFNERQIKTVHDLLNAQMNPYVHIINVSQLHKWLDILEKIPDKVRQQSIFVIKDILNSSII